MLRTRTADMGLPEFRVLVANARPELVVVADDLIPGDRLVEPGGLVRFLIIDGIGPGMSAGTGGNDLAVKDIDKPSQFVILGIVDVVAERDAEIEGRFLVQGVDRPDGGIEDVGRRENDGRIGTGIELARARTKQCAPAGVDRLSRGFLVGDMNVADGEECQKPRRIGCVSMAGGKFGPLVVRLKMSEIAAVIRAGPCPPGAVTVFLVERHFWRVDFGRVRR